MKNFIKLSIVGIMLIIISGCGRTASPKYIGKSVANLENKTVVIKSEIPFSEDAIVSNAIKNECTLPIQLSGFIKTFSSENGVNIVVDDKATVDKSEYYLDVKIIDSVSRGNAFIGHYKMTKIKGTLYNNNKEIANFIGARKSGGGFAAGFKGSCSVLGRTVEALGKDIGQWIKAPSKNARLGDL